MAARPASVALTHLHYRGQLRMAVHAREPFDAS
jgi:hypothetical protein